MKNFLAFVMTSQLALTLLPASADPLTGNVRENATRVSRPALPQQPNTAPLSSGLSENAFKLNAQDQGAGTALLPVSAVEERQDSSAAVQSPLRGSASTTTLQPSASENHASGGTTGGASQAPIIDDYNKKPLQGSVTFRFCYFDLGDGAECCWEGLRDAIYLQGKGVDIAIMLDRGGVRLANKHNMHELQLHRGSTEKLIKTQELLRGFIDKGGTVIASERWSKEFGLIGGSYPSLTPGVKLASDEEMADLLVERAGRIVEY